jgi:hypothetical protein
MINGELELVVNFVSSLFCNTFELEFVIILIFLIIIFIIFYN